MSPSLHRGRAWLASVNEVTVTRLRFGAVPHLGATPAADTTACEWIVDGRTSQRALIIAEVDDSGQAREVLRVALRELSGSHLALQLDGSRLRVLTSSMGFVTWTVLDLDRISAPPPR